MKKITTLALTFALSTAILKAASTAEVMPDAPSGFIHIVGSVDKSEKGEYYIQRQHIASITIWGDGDEEGEAENRHYRVTIRTVATTGVKTAFSFKFPSRNAASDFVKRMLK